MKLRLKNMTLIFRKFRTGWSITVRISFEKRQ